MLLLLYWFSLFCSILFYACGIFFLQVLPCLCLVFPPSFMSPVYYPYIEKLRTILSPDDTNILDDTQKLTELILDPSKGHRSQTRQRYAQMYQLEAVGRDLIYTLHCQRANLLRA